MNFYNTPITKCRLAHKLITTPFYIFTFLFYLYTATSIHRPFSFAVRDWGEHYNLLADAFLAGRCHLTIIPRKELIELPNPYDPVQHVPYGLWDASLYNGRYYLYFGPTPVLTLLIPLRLIFGRPISQTVAAALFSYGGIIGAAFLLCSLAKRFFPSTPFWMMLLSIVCVSYCNVIPCTLSGGEVYQVAILSGFFFLFWSLYFLISGSYHNTTKPLKLLIGSLFLGLAVGARCDNIFAALILPVTYFRLARNCRRDRTWQLLKLMILLFIPFALCLLMLGYYNFIRYGSWLETGLRYLLSEVNSSELLSGKIFSAAHIVPGLYFYFLNPYSINMRFPYFHIGRFSQATMTYPWPLPPGYRIDQAAGILTYMPVLYLLFTYPFIFRKIRLHKELHSIIATLLAISLLLIVFIVPFRLSCIRYQVTFVNLLVFVSIMIWLILDNLLVKRLYVRLLLRSLVAAAIIYGSVVNIAFSFYFNCNFAFF